MLTTRAETSLEDALHVGNETELRAAVDNAEAGVHIVIALDRDITITEQLDISDNKNITLTSNSATEFFKLSRSALGTGGGTIGVWAESTLELAGIIVTHVQGTGGGVVVTPGCTLTLSSGEISGNGPFIGSVGGGVVNLGHFIMTGGTISDNSIGRSAGGGVYNTGNFTMTGGTITNNIGGLLCLGGGVYNEGGNFSMYGGAISGNNIGLHGGGVYNNGGNFNMFGGVISGNTAYVYGGGVYNEGGN
ncbi:MAG: hypothetical protein LBI79_10015, partial [Nitrososphaerota archaeon]|nr:hypothetical protein [Nitrososphaerota archaeon]